MSSVRVCFSTRDAPPETLQFFAGLRTDRFHGMELSISSIADHSRDIANFDFVSIKRRSNREGGERGGSVDIARNDRSC